MSHILYQCKKIRKTVFLKTKTTVFKNYSGGMPNSQNWNNTNVHQMMNG